MYATLLDPNQLNHYFSASPVRAREHQIRAPEKGILGGMRRVSYPTHVTVYPYNGYIAATNPVVRHVMSLTCNLKQMYADQRVPKHAATQPLQSRGIACCIGSPYSRHTAASSEAPSICTHEVGERAGAAQWSAGEESAQQRHGQTKAWPAWQWLLGAFVLSPWHYLPGHFA